jgi:nitroreductase
MLLISSGCDKMELMDVIEGRKSYRAFDPVEITDEMVNDLMNAASRAPSCNNNQPWRFIFIRERDRLEMLKHTLSRGNYWGKRASMIVAVLSKPDLDCQGEEGDYNLLDTGMAMENLLLRATEIGLATHPIAGFDHEKARVILEVPEDYQLLPLIIFGKRSSDPGLLVREDHKKTETTRSERKPLNEVMEHERFGFTDRS